MNTAFIRELATLPEPGLIETLSFEAIFIALVQDFQTRYPEFTALLESDPAIKLLEVASYRELLLRNRINEAARGQMLVFASATDLDHLGAFYGVARLEGEGDSALRRRIQQRIMGFSNAGGADTYRYWALTASPEVADVAVTSPQPGHVRISVLSRLGDGTASEELLDAVKAVVLRDDIRVLTDTVHVLGAEIVPIDVTANIWLYPDSVAEIMDALPGYLASEFAAAATLGFDITRSWLTGRLHVPGVHKVELLAPETDIRIQPWQVARLNACVLDYAGRDK
jgi:phage-related baseplate assembly protein